MRHRFFPGLTAVVLATGVAAVLALHSYSQGQSNLERKRPPATSSPAFLRLKRVRIVDNKDFSESVEVMSLLIPADWRFEGQAKWFFENRSCPETENISAIVYHASSPDGLWSLEKLPNSFWRWISNPPMESAESMNSCPFHEPLSPESYVSEQLLPKMRPGARVVSVQHEGEMSQAITELVKRGNATAVYLGSSVTAKAECARVAYEFPNNGQLIQESILGTVVTMINRRPIISSTERGHSTGYSDYYTIHASDFYASRAPEEQAQSSGKVFARILMSSRANPRWIEGRKQIASRLAHNPEISEGAIQHSKLPELTPQQILDAYRKQSEARMPIVKGYDPSIVGLEPFLDPGTNEVVELNGGFAFAWSNHQDEYVLTNEANFNPAIELKESWARLQHVDSHQH